MSMHQLHNPDPAATPGAKEVPEPQPYPWESCRILVPREHISYIVSIFEGYDNEFLVRTEQKGLGILRVWYPAHCRPTLDQVLREMGTEFELQVLAFAPGMDGLDEVYPD